MLPTQVKSSSKSKQNTYIQSTFDKLNNYQKYIINNLRREGRQKQIQLNNFVVY